MVTQCHTITQTMQSLEIVRSALEDPHLRPARRLSLLQRAHKLCQSSDGPATSREKKGVASRRKNSGKIPPSKRRRPSAFTLNDFPMMDLITAPEVSISGKQYHSDLRSVFAASTDDSPDSCSLVRVEGFAMYHYSNVEGWPCAVHAEASSFTAMFVLLMWDVIFTPGIPDVFRTPYQVEHLTQAIASFPGGLGMRLFRLMYTTYMAIKTEGLSHYLSCGFTYIVKQLR